MNEAVKDTPETAACPFCEEHLTHDVVTQEFEYASSGTTVILRANVPTEHCSACGYTAYGEAGERAKTEAVYHHLGRLSPWEIVAIRDQLGLSQSAFADWIGVGKASLERWERGAVMHNQSMDNLILALSDPSRKAAIDRERTIRLHKNTVSSAVVDFTRFRALRVEDAEDLATRQAGFRLRSLR